MVTDNALYKVMKEKYLKYVSINFLMQYCHVYDIQLNEDMNRSVMKYVPKGTHFFQTSSLVTGVNIAAGIQLVGNHFSGNR